MAWLFGFLTTFVGYLLVRALVTGRIPAARTFTKTHYAERDGSPILYWFFTLLNGLVLILAASAFAHELYPAVPSLIAP